MGDAALQTVANVLKDMFRAEDIVGRLGGDEFCIFINHVMEDSMIENRLFLLNERCRKDYPVKEKEPIHVSASIGAVICSEKISSYEEAYELCDKALYESKQKGKNCFTIIRG